MTPTPNKTSAEEAWAEERNPQATEDWHKRLRAAVQAEIREALATLEARVQHLYAVRDEELQSAHHEACAMAAVEDREPTELEELAWRLIANAYGGDWDTAHEDWKAAACRWRDTYHAKLDRAAGLSSTPVTPPDKRPPESDDASDEPSGTVEMPEGEHGYAFREWRAERGLSLRETAAMLGVTHVRLGEFERGVRRAEPPAESERINEMQADGPDVAATFGQDPEPPASDPPPSFRGLTYLRDLPEWPTRNEIINETTVARGDISRREVASLAYDYIGKVRARLSSPPTLTQAPKKKETTMGGNIEAGHEMGYHMRPCPTCNVMVAGRCLRCHPEPQTLEERVAALEKVLNPPPRPNPPTMTEADREELEILLSPFLDPAITDPVSRVWEIVAGRVGEQVERYPLEGGAWTNDPLYAVSSWQRKCEELEAEPRTVSEGEFEGTIVDTAPGQGGEIIDDITVRIPRGCAPPVRTRVRITRITETPSEEQGDE